MIEPKVTMAAAVANTVTDDGVSLVLAATANRSKWLPTVQPLDVTFADKLQELMRVACENDQGLYITALALPRY